MNQKLELKYLIVSVSIIIFISIILIFQNNRNKKFNNITY